MATEGSAETATNTTNNGTTDETSGQATNQDGQGTTTPETGGNGTTQETSNKQEPVTLPDDHPLVKTLASQKQALATQKTELAEARAKSAKVTELEEALNKRPTQEALDTLQTRYDRLEAFLIAAGGPLGKALDSRTFTRDLFETDKDIEDLVKDWHKSNPTATAKALGAGGADPNTNKGPSMNEILRAARKGS